MGKIDFSVGEFDTRVELYSPELKQTVSGAVEKNFTVRGVVYAKVRSRNMGEDTEGAILITNIQEIVSYDVPGVDNAWRIKKDNEMYDVISVDRIQRRFMKITAKRIV